MDKKDGKRVTNKEGRKVKIQPDSLRATPKRYQTGKLLVMMTYMDSGLKTSLPSMIDWLSKCLEETDLPEWVTKRKTTLIQNDPKKMPPNNYRPITCLLIMWKIPTAQIREISRISLTLSRHFSLSFIASGRSSGLHSVSSHSCCMYVRDGRPAFAWPYAGVYRGTSLMSSSLLLQQCPACLVRLTWIVFVMGGRWPYSWCFVGCCRQDLFNIARSILV